MLELFKLHNALFLVRDIKVMTDKSSRTFDDMVRQQALLFSEDDQDQQDAAAQIVAEEVQFTRFKVKLTLLLTDTVGCIPALSNVYEELCYVLDPDEPGNKLTLDVKCSSSRRAMDIKANGELWFTTNVLVKGTPKLTLRDPYDELNLELVVTVLKDDAPVLLAALATSNAMIDVYDEQPDLFMDGVPGLSGKAHKAVDDFKRSLGPGMTATLSTETKTVTVEGR